MLITVLPAAAIACGFPSPGLLRGLPDAPPWRMSADGALHVLRVEPREACWWIVDDAGDARLGGRWDRARKDPAALVALADGRVVVALRGPEGAWRLSVRAEGEGDRCLGVLPAAPASLEPDPERPRVGWAATPGAAPTWVDVPAAPPTSASRDATRSPR